MNEITGTNKAFLISNLKNVHGIIVFGDSVPYEFLYNEGMHLCKLAIEEHNFSHERAIDFMLCLSTMLENCLLGYYVVVYTNFTEITIIPYKEYIKNHFGNTEYFKNIILVHK